MAVADINLQDTVRIPQEEEERNGGLNDSILDLSEVQLQERLDRQTNELENGRNAVDGNTNNPPTHTDHEGSERHQLLRETETQ